MSDPIPERIGKYEVVARVGVGGMAEVFRARVVGDGGFEKVVAIKRILPQLALDDSYVQMFFDEARISARLDHRNIVHVFELGSDREVPFIAMQLVDGLDVLAILRECVRTGLRLPPNLAAFIAREVLDALDHAHNATDPHGTPLRVVHRDVSPGNVLVSWRGDVKLTDFGIARAAEKRRASETGLLKGKYGYMSPEQVMGDALDARSDLFSMGVVLAEMVMARRLFSAPSELDALVMVRDARLDRLHARANAFPLQLRVLIVRALQRRPEDRWSSAREFRDALDEWLSSEAPARPRDVADFLAKMLAAPDVPRAGGVSSPNSSVSTLSRAFITDAKAIVAEAPSGGVPIVVEDSDLAGEASSPHTAPAERGNFSKTPLMAVLYRLAQTEASGLLICNHPNGIIKEAFIAGGTPAFVNSTDPKERLGQFLVKVGAITAAQLEAAVAAAPAHKGRLSDALVELGILSPLDAYRLLAQQVGAKLIEGCSWASGNYAWIVGGENPWKARPLHLDSYRIIGAGATQLDMTFAEAWAAERMQFIGASRGHDSELLKFGLGEALIAVKAMLRRGETLAALLARPRSKAARGNLMRLLYLLELASQAEFAPRDRN